MKNQRRRSDEPAEGDEPEMTGTKPTAAFVNREPQKPEITILPFILLFSTRHHNLPPNIIFVTWPFPFIKIKVIYFNLFLFLFLFLFEY